MYKIIQKTSFSVPVYLVYKKCINCIPVNLKHHLTHSWGIKICRIKVVVISCNLRKMYTILL